MKTFLEFLEDYETFQQDVIQSIRTIVEENGEEDENAYSGGDEETYCGWEVTCPGLFLPIVPYRIRLRNIHSRREEDGAEGKELEIHYLWACDGELLLTMEGKRESVSFRWDYFDGWACYEDHADSEESKEVVPCRVTVREMLDLHRLAEYSAQSDKFLVPGVEQLFEVEPMDDEAAKAEIEAGEELMDDLFMNIAGFDSYFIYSSGQSEDGAVLAFKVDLTVYVKMKRRWFAGSFEAAAIDSHFNIYNSYGDQILMFKDGRFFVKDIFDGTLREALMPVPVLEKLNKEMERSFYFADSMGIHQV